MKKITSDLDTLKDDIFNAIRDNIPYDMGKKITLNKVFYCIDELIIKLLDDK